MDLICNGNRSEITMFVLLNWFKHQKLDLKFKNGHLLLYHPNPDSVSGQMLQEDQIWLLIKNKNSEHLKSPKGHSVSRKKFWDLWVSRSRCQFVSRYFDLILLTFKWGELLQKDQIWLLIKNNNSDDPQPPKGHSVSRKKFWDLWVSRSRCQFVSRASGQENWERSDK